MLRKVCEFLPLLIVTLASLDANAATFSLNSTLVVKVVASSSGVPCEFDCWERWQSTQGLGTFLVVKDASGRIESAGRITQPYFADLYASVDEAVRKIPPAQQAERIGWVSNMGARTSCASKCVLFVNFGGNQEIDLTLGADGKFSMVRDLGENIGPVLAAPSGPTNAGGLPSCVAGQPEIDCIETRVGVGWRGGIVGAGLEIVAIYIYYDAQGRIVMQEIEYSNGMVIQIF